jgi:AraC family transcriptional regulator, regulatory protein of adaptative response / DNA-3-methyladenine glycosylase II
MFAALAARDARFDGVFFVGVTSTGIYCRPICPAKAPKAANCRFFASAAAAEHAAFRPCLRCRPELAPGLAPVDGGRRLAGRIARRIGDGIMADGAWLDALAAEFHMSARQLRRIVTRELGVPPVQLLLTHRLLLAKQLLTETRLSVTEVAYASGFGSLRRFNDAFVGRYGMAPARLRGRAVPAGPASVAPLGSAIAVPTAAPAAPAPPPGPAETPLTLQLAWRPPFDWDALLSFIAARAIAGVEAVADGAYARTVRLADAVGWLRVRPLPGRRVLQAEVSATLAPALPLLLGKLRGLFDLDARPDVIDAHLAADPLLAPLVAARPGLRVPGAFDGFELAARAILGQQVTVRGATTLAGRYADAFGEEVAPPAGLPALRRLTPTAERVAAAGEAEVAALGMPAARARSLVALAREVAVGRIRLEPGVDVDATIARLIAVPGVGPWTAHYIALRALRWPDAFPREDRVLRARLGEVGAAAAGRRAEPWRPWRGYAALHLWHAGTPPSAPLTAAAARPG